ncbi:MAG: hypothetical protein AVDCRST_MAG35-296, partial [uncultured Quadrisphaera sp.]
EARAGRADRARDGPGRGGRCAAPGRRRHRGRRAAARGRAGAGAAAARPGAVV